MKKLPDPLKIGTTLKFDIRISEAELGTYSLASQIRNKNWAKIADVAITPSQITVTDTNAVYVAVGEVDESVTLGFPVTTAISPLYTDVFLRINGDTFATDTYVLDTIRNQTDPQFL